MEKVNTPLAVALLIEPQAGLLAVVIKTESIQ
jgi:hypothetical protein